MIDPGSEAAKKVKQDLEDNGAFVILEATVQRQEKEPYPVIYTILATWPSGRKWRIEEIKEDL